MELQLGVEHSAERYVSRLQEGVPVPTVEERREWGRQGVMRKKMLRAKRAADPMYAIREALPDALRDLVAASRGQGRWSDLPIKDQLGALQKVVEYGFGKAVTLDKMRPSDAAEDGDAVEEADGIALG